MWRKIPGLKNYMVRAPDLVWRQALTPAEVRLQRRLDESRLVGQRQTSVILTEEAAQKNGHWRYCKKAGETWLQRAREWFEMNLRKWLGLDHQPLGATLSIWAFIMLGHHFPVLVISHHYCQRPQHPFRWLLSSIGLRTPQPLLLLPHGCCGHNSTKTVHLSFIQSSAECKGRDQIGRLHRRGDIWPSAFPQLDMGNLRHTQVLLSLCARLAIRGFNIGWGCD